MRPRLLDLFCGAGGAAMGYHRAGFDVVGVDINPQPHYPFGFIHGDAISFLEYGAGEGFDAIHASPPCQGFSALKGLVTKDYPRLIEETRGALVWAGKPWIMENVVGAPLVNPIRLCGSSFSLGVRRHRLFEMSDPPALVPTCAHHLQPEPIDVSGTGARRLGDRLDGRGGNSRKPRNLYEARQAMGIDWMTRPELSEAIPPAYTEWIGARLLEVIAAESVA